MKFIKKVTYKQDIRLFKDGSYVFWYGLLGVGLLFAPLFFGEYYIQQLTFVCIYGLAGVGLMLLSGFTGLISLGHAACLGAGAYTAAILNAQGVDFILVLMAAAFITALLGAVIGLPALRHHGLYLAIATLAFAFIVTEVFQRWKSVTHGNRGFFVGKANVAGFPIETTTELYYLSLVIVILGTIAALNLLRTPTGRAMIAIRDSETAAQSMGVNLAKVKTQTFAISAAYTGVSGALLAHAFQFIVPEVFDINVSIELLLVIFVGGIGSIRGAFFGAIFLVMLPQVVAILKDYLPQSMASQAGLQLAIFGLILLLIILFEPGGINAIWVKIKYYLDVFPMYRRSTFKRQKSFTKAETW